jgi:hypothetical protein
MTSFLAPYPTFGTKNKRLPPSQYERSPYYWWFEYLRRNADYIKCCEANGKTKLSKLYEDFGDVRDIEFRVWWTKEQKGTQLFGEKKFGIKFEFAIHQSTTPYVLICIKLADRYDCPVTGSLNQVGS